MLMKTQTDELYCHPDVLDAGKKVVQELFRGGGGANVGEELNRLKVINSLTPLYSVRCTSMVRYPYLLLACTLSSSIGPVSMGSGLSTLPLQP